jgi:hypothetical protein
VRLRPLDRGDPLLMSQVLDFRSARAPVADDCEAGLEVCPASSMKSVDSLNDRHFLSASARVRAASAAARTASRPSKGRIGGSSRRAMFRTAAAALIRVAGLRAIVLALKPRDSSDRRGIGGIVREKSSHRRELEDPARSLASHHRDGRLGQVHNAKEISFKLGAEVLSGRVFDRGKVPIAGVVDQHIEAAEDVNGQLDGRHRRTVIGDIQRDGAHVVAVTLNQIGELLWIAGGGDQPVASCEDGLGDRPTYPPSASRDQPYVRHGIPIITKLMFSFIVTAQRPVLRRLFLERFYLPRRAMNLDLVQQAIDAGELPRDTDADLLIDALTGPLYFRRIIGHAPVSEAFASELASRVLQGFRRPVGP